MKTVFALPAFFLSLVLSAQNADSVSIKASDPTQLYTFVEGYAGLNFFVSLSEQIPIDVDTWQFGFRGNWAMKKFRMGVDLSASNNSTQTRILDDIEINLGYQVHNNTGVYNATVINTGFISPSQDDLWDLETFVYPKNSMFNTYYFNYIGSIKISERFAFYPGVEWFNRMNNPSTSYIFFDQDSGYSAPTILSRGWKFTGVLCYDINRKNFMQLSAGWSTENWEAKYGSVQKENDYLSNISEKRLSAQIRYQHAFTPFAQAYAKLLYNDYRFDDGDPRTDSIEGQITQLYSLQLGFIYFLR